MIASFPSSRFQWVGRKSNFEKRPLGLPIDDSGVFRLARRVNPTIGFILVVVATASVSYGMRTVLALLLPGLPKTVVQLGITITIPIVAAIAVERLLGYRQESKMWEEQAKLASGDLFLFKPIRVRGAGPFNRSDFIDLISPDLFVRLSDDARLITIDGDEVCKADLDMEEYPVIEGFLNLGFPSRASGDYVSFAYAGPFRAT